MKETKPRHKERYEAPVVRRIRIVPGELGVTGCKEKTSRMGPTTGCFVSNCKAVGS